MNQFLVQTLTKLNTEFKTYPAAEGVQVTSILASIKHRTPEQILKEIDLPQFQQNYEALSEKTIPELNEYLKTDVGGKKVIDILIAIYILKGSKGNLDFTKYIEAPAIHVKNKYLNQDLAYLSSQNKKKPVKQPVKLISNYVHGLRLMPSGSPFPGIYDIYKTPHIIEILNNLSPYSQIRGTAVKKSVQNAFTTGVAENGIAYYIGARPANIMYLTGTDALLKKFGTGRLQPLIDSCGFQKLIYSQSTKKNNRSTGDTAIYKEFVGGRLTLGSLQSEATMRQESVQIMFRDEIDLIGSQMSSGEGNPLSVSDGRLEAYGDRGKTMDFSTPKEYGNSLIDIQYAKGDKRKYFVPCPMCGKTQFLCRGDEKSNFGLKGDYKAGRLIQGYYLCYHCHDAIFESSKIKMFYEGVWLPTVANPPDKYFRSYHSPAFYSPPGMISWTKMRKLYDEAQKEGDDGMRSFTNLYEAKSFRPSGERPKLESVYELRSRKYKSGEVPDGIMWLTMMGDVQRGKDKWNGYTSSEISDQAAKHLKKKEYAICEGMPRIEVEVMGHGAEFRTASIIYKTFYGKVSDHTSGAWSSLLDWIKETKLIFKRKDGYAFSLEMIFIDSGYATDEVYNFCDPLPMTYPSKGDRDTKSAKLKNVAVDTERISDWSRFRLSTSGSHAIVLIRTNYYKKNIYKKLNNKMGDLLIQPPNSHITPEDYPDSYFSGLTAEEMKKDGSFHNTANRRNEPLDLMVGNLAGSDFWIEGRIMADREVLKKRHPNYSKEKLREIINRKTITDKYESQLRESGW